MVNNIMGQQPEHECGQQPEHELGQHPFSPWIAFFCRRSVRYVSTHGTLVSRSKGNGDSHDWDIRISVSERADQRYRWQASWHSTPWGPNLMLLPSACSRSILSSSSLHTIQSSIHLFQLRSSARWLCGLMFGFVPPSQ
jgi:hypothetical protein